MTAPIPPRDFLAPSHPKRRVVAGALPTTDTWKKMTFYKRELPSDYCIAFSSAEVRPRHSPVPPNRLVFVYPLSPLDPTATAP